MLIEEGTNDFKMIESPLGHPRSAEARTQSEGHRMDTPVFSACTQIEGAGVLHGGLNKTSLDTNFAERLPCHTCIPYLIRLSKTS